eukprot:3051713-Prymnesium_polylepis.1
MLASSLALGCTLDLDFAPRRALGEATRWVYAGEAGRGAQAAAQASSWVDYSACRGLAQSPIDVRTDTTRPSPALNQALAPHLRPHVPLLFNTGHYFELDKTTPEHLVRPAAVDAARPGGGDKGWSKILNETYRFYQVHWHVPSENRIDGKQFAMEAHFVHQLDDARLVGSNERLAVIAVMYELSDVCNEELEQFWSSLPMVPGDAPFDRSVDIGAWLEPLLPGGYFSWAGSLTTPPCSEGVSWNLLKRASHACAAQIDRLKASLAKMQQGVDVNNRVVQPLHGRVVRESTTLDPASARSTKAWLVGEQGPNVGAGAATPLVALAAVGSALCFVARPAWGCRNGRRRAGCGDSAEER